MFLCAAGAKSSRYMPLTVFRYAVFLMRSAIGMVAGVVDGVMGDFLN
jgi:hypothetical protein